jgi:hypothetical protein
MAEKLLRIEEVALLVNTSTQTINNWYRWKKLHPEHSLAKLLPDYIQSGPRQTRYWKRTDVWSIAEFKNNIPHGRNGILGEITQKSSRVNKQMEE